MTYIHLSPYNRLWVRLHMYDPGTHTFWMETIQSYSRSLQDKGYFLLYDEARLCLVKIGNIDCVVYGPSHGYDPVIEPVPEGRGSDLASVVVALKRLVQRLMGVNPVSDNLIFGL